MTDRKTIRLVILLLGIATLGAILGTFVLAERVLDQAAGSGTPDAAAVGIVGILAAFATGGLGYLGGVLASTRSTPDKAEIDAALAPLVNGGAGVPVIVNNTEREPAHVDVVQPERAEAHGELPSPPPE